jgi:hypothetical protein
MTNAHTAAGYIVSDNEGTIHGYGATADAAWSEMLRAMQQAGIAVLDDDADSTEQSGSWTRESGMKLLPATAALLADVDTKGCAIRWDVVGGVAVLS